MMSSNRRTALYIFGYGSLTYDLGAELTQFVVEAKPLRSPWRVEYGRHSRSREGAPTLVFDDKGATVTGRLLRLKVEPTPQNILKVRTLVNAREGHPGMSCIKVAHVGGFQNVVFCDLPPTPDMDKSPGALADAAIKSVLECLRKGKLERNGIRYLQQSMDMGIITPLTKEYEASILNKTKAKSLDEAEHKIVQSARPSSTT